MDTETIWQKVLNYIKQQTSQVNYRTWFSQTAIREISDQKVIILVPSAFIKGQLLARYQPLIEQALEEVLNSQPTIEVVVEPSFSQKKSPSEKLEDSDESELFSFQPSSPPQSTTLNPKYQLKNFVVGLTNNLAYAAAQAVTQNPGVSYNPLFIYGPSGVGKTHLMQGVGNGLLEKNPYLRIIYISSERFMVDFVDSIQTKKMGDFRSRYRNCDILLVDDIQFISGKDSMQEEFFHTYNELHAKNSQLIFTSDRPPNEIDKIEDRLRSRFQGGLMVDIQMPDFETRVAILKAKLAEKGEVLPDEVLHSIADNMQTNTRELEGKLIQILQLSKLKNEVPTLENLKQYLSTPQSISQTQKLDYKKLLNGINQYFSIKMAELTGPRRQKELVLPRQIAMFLMYEECKIPMERIGQILGGRDHTTVLHGVEKMRAVIKRDREVQRLIIEIKQQVGG